VEKGGKIMEINQVVKLHLLDLSKDDKAQLFNVGEQYRQACNYVSDYVFNNGFELNSNKLHKHLYQDVRQRFNLKAQLAASVMKTVTARYKTVQTQLRQHPYRLKDENGHWKNIPKDLEWIWKPIVFKRRQADYQKTRDYAFTKDLKQIMLSVLTVAFDLLQLLLMRRSSLISFLEKKFYKREPGLISAEPFFNMLVQKVPSVV
jgi:putative transposase